MTSTASGAHMIIITTNIGQGGERTERIKVKPGCAPRKEAWAGACWVSAGSSRSRRDRATRCCTSSTSTASIRRAELWQPALTTPCWPANRAGLGGIYWGAYDRKLVEDERDDLSGRDFYARDLKIITTDPEQAAIDAAVRALNTRKR